jgi:hypothetical protein
MTTYGREAMQRLGDACGKAVASPEATLRWLGTLFNPADDSRALDGLSVMESSVVLIRESPTANDVSRPPTPHGCRDPSLRRVDHAASGQACTFAAAEMSATCRLTVTETTSR